MIAANRRDVLDHSDAELLLEAFAHSALELDNRIISIQSRMKNTEEFLKIHYDRHVPLSHPSSASTLTPERNPAARETD